MCVCERERERQADIHTYIQTDREHSYYIFVNGLSNSASVMSIQHFPSVLYVKQIHERGEYTCMYKYEQLIFDFDYEIFYLLS